LYKKPGESYQSFLTRLKEWVRSTGLLASDEWYVKHLKASIDPGNAGLIGQETDPVKIVQIMDSLKEFKHTPESEAMTDMVKTVPETAFGKQKGKDDQVSDDDDDVDEEEQVDAVTGRSHRFKHKRGGRGSFSGKRRCFYCGEFGHIKKDCPHKKERGEKKSHSKGNSSHYVASMVYAIEEKAAAPMVIGVKVGKITINAMIDSGSMENVIDIKALNQLIPGITLQKFGKRLIGADRKPITVRGSARVTMKIAGVKTSLQCIAVENLNTKLIIGMPGLRSLGISADFATRTLKMGDRIVNTIGEVGYENHGSVSNISVDIDKNLSPRQQDEMREITDKWKHTLVEKIEDRGPAKGYTFSIDTGKAKPIYVPLRTYSPKEQEELDKQIDEMLKKHIITRTRSPWSAPVLLVKKKDNSYRVVVDYTRLNEKTEDDPFPLPIPRTTFGVLSEARYFSSLDLASGYWQVEVDKKDIPKTAFNTRKGTFAYLRMPMGLKGAPSAFQRFMTEIFADLMYQGVLVFIDDILIYSKTWKEHLRLVNKVLKRLSDHNLQAKVGKCHFGAKEVKYLGSVVSYNCRRPDPEKVRAIKELEPPKTKDDVRSILGLVGFYREFMKDLSSVTEPLQKLMRKDTVFQWGTEQQKAFDEMKKGISEKSCLEFPRPGWPYELHTDASLNGIGAVLFQKDPQGKLHTIEFASKALSKAQKRQAIPVLECYAIVWALKKFRCYVHGVHVDVYTDHYGLQYMKMKKNPPAQMQRWWWDIADYDFDIYYKQGKTNIADPLSRLMPQAELDQEDENDMKLINAIDRDVRKHAKVVEILERRMRNMRREYLVRWDGVNGPLSWESRYAIRNNELVKRFDIQADQLEKEKTEETLKRTQVKFSKEKLKEAQEVDSWCQELRKAMSGEPTAEFIRKDAEQCVELEGMIYHKVNKKQSFAGQLQVVIPQAFRRQLVEEIHGGVLGGHFGLDRTLSAVGRHYWWHGMRKEVQEIIKGCPQCNARNPLRGEKRPLLQPEERTGVPWERVGIDYTDMARSEDGYSKILVMIDHATKFVIAKATKDGSAETAAKIVFEELICKYGAPQELWSDRGKSFMSELTGYLSELFGIKQKFTSGYHPQTNGLTERFNRTIVAELAKAVNDQKNDWPTWLPAKVLAYNMTIQKSTGYAPFELIHTFFPRTPLDNELVRPPETMKRKEWAEDIYKKAEEMRKDALRNQLAAAAAQKRYYDEGLEPETFDIGDLVRVYDPTAENSKPVKFRNQWIGPYFIEGKEGMLYRLRDLKGAVLKSLYHPIKLKKVNEERVTQQLL